MKLTKKIFSAVTAAVCTLTVCFASISAGVSAENVVTNSVTYRTFDDHVEVAECDPTATSVSVLKEVYNLPVTAIAKEAFKGCSALTEVTIPESVTEIGDYAFNGCSALISAAIPSSVTRIGDSAFSGTSLFKGQDGPIYYVGKWAVECAPSTKAINLQSGTRGIADSTFASKGIQTAAIPDSVITIGAGAFANNSEIKTFTVPDSVITIGDEAFYNCRNLQTVKIGSKVATIGYEAFYNCTNLDGVKIPNSVTKMGEKAFGGTKQYTDQTGPLFYIDTWLVGCLITTSQSIDIQKGTRGIADRALSNNEFITSAGIPSGVVTIGDYAFATCEQLSQLTIPDTVTSIGTGAFMLSTIPSVTIPASVASIGSGAFAGCNNLESITILNPTCSIYNDSMTISSTAKMYVIENSTAFNYAKTYNRKFDFVEENKIMKGDVNSDGKLGLQDIIEIAKYMLKKRTFTEQEFKAADYNGDGKVGLQDIIPIAKYLLDKGKK